jgi:long-chain acyl-CoA synthetase
MKAFRGLGFGLYEGYGLTEAAPVLTVNRPGAKLVPGSVGEPLPGIEVRIAEPDASGVGEVIASGPNVMLGYYEDAAATREAIRDGWLHTGDLGRFDDEKRLYIVGRKKEMILGANGENVYPDELEERYADSPLVKELSIVGLPAPEHAGELVACLVVPDYEREGGRREEVRERVREHFKSVSGKLPPAKRVKVLHFTDVELPRTATRKVKRKLVVEELQKLERVRHLGERRGAGDGLASAAAAGGGDDGRWLAELLAAVTGAPLDRLVPEARLEELGVDSLMYTELGVALEAAGVAVPEGADLTGVGTVGELGRLVAGWGAAVGARRKPAKHARTHDGDDPDAIEIPESLARLGSAGLDWAQRMTYERLFQTRITGRAHLPRSGRFIVAANHASHLDMGLVKHALGEWGPRLVALAAKDYFFEDPVKRAYFENFTSLVPMERHGSLRESLRLAAEVVRQGYVLLIFPEGTRSESGVMREFKPSIGYLALSCKVDVLPMFLEGTHAAMPKGSVLPKRRDIAAHIGPVLSYASLRAAIEGLPRGEHYRMASRRVEDAVRALARRSSKNMHASFDTGGELEP